MTKLNVSTCLRFNALFQSALLARLKFQFSLPATYGSKTRIAHKVEMRNFPGLIDLAAKNWFKSQLLLSLPRACNNWLVSNSFGKYNYFVIVAVSFCGMSSRIVHAWLRTRGQPSASSDATIERRFVLPSRLVLEICRLNSSSQSS